MANEAEFPFYFPEDLIPNIFLRLPIKSLLVCTSVCKTWNSFIKSPEFFSFHLKNSISSREENDSGLCLLQLCSLPVDTGTDRFFLRFGDKELSEYKRLHFPCHPDQFGFQVVASCNGLVYFMRGRYNSFSTEWILWNPATRKTKIITEHQNVRAMEAVGVGFDSKTRDYKILSIVEELGRDENLRVNLYSLKANSWKQLPDLDFMNKNYRTMHREMAFVNGVLHFVAYRNFREPRFMILGFDVADEIFRQIMLPDCMANHFSDHFLSTCGESLSLLWLKDRDLNMEIWVMKEYGVEGSWTKVSVVNRESLLDSMYLPISGFVFKKESHVLFSSFRDKKAVGRIFSHDLKSQETKEIEIVGRNACCYLGNYVESLVLLDDANDRPSEIERDNIYLRVDEANDQPSESESDDGNDASGTGSSSNAGYEYDHGDLGAEVTADSEEDSDESDSSSHESDE